MRRIVMFNHVSADGYFAGPDGGLDWVVPDEELDKSSTEGFAHTDAILLGRKTYEMFASYWPHALEDATTAADPQDAERRTKELRDLAVWLNATTKIVFSRTLREATWGPSRVVDALDPRAIEAMKREPGGDMIVFGSGSLVSGLTEHGLIDEYQLIVNPVILGSGRPLLEDVSKQIKLSLVEARPFPSGNVRLRYARAG